MFQAIKKIEELLEAQQYNSGVYIEAIPDPSAIEKTWTYLRKVGIPVMPAQKAHTTIIYSKHSPKTPVKIKDIYIEAKPIAFRIFGRGTKDSPYALVIELNSPQLKKLHDYYMREYNLKYDFNDYIPHLTVTYDIERVMPGLKKLNNKQKQTIENIFSKMVPELPQKIRFIKQRVSNLNENWSP